MMSIVLPRFEARKSLVLLALFSIYMVKSESSYSNEFGCEVVANGDDAINGDGRAESFHIGFTILSGIGYADQIDYFRGLNHIPANTSGTGYCVGILWDEKTEDDLTDGAHDDPVSLARWREPQTPNLDVGGGKDRLNVVKVWYDNDICKIRLYPQLDDSWYYCELHVGHCNGGQLIFMSGVLDVIFGIQVLLKMMYVQAEYHLVHLLMVMDLNHKLK